jgi:hypothetical protein
MEGHVSAVAALQIGYSILGAFLGLFILIVLWVLNLDACCPGRQFTLWIIGTGIAIFLFLLSILGIIGGLGLYKHKNWARILILILSGIDLFNIPIGTALGIYSIWVLVQDDTVQLFAN